MRCVASVWKIVSCVALAWSTVGCGAADTDSDGGTRADASVVDPDAACRCGDASTPDGGAADGGDASTADGGSLPDECALPTDAAPMSVADFGAVGDGTTDDTEALRDAFAAVTSGGNVRFEAGRTYLISGTLRLRDAMDVGVDGNGATLFMADGTPTDSHRMLDMARCTRCVVRDLALDGNRDGRVPAERAGAHVVAVGDSEDFAFCRVAVRNSTCDGFYVAAGDSTDPATYARRGLFQDCSADNGYRQGMSIINGTDIRVIGGFYSNTHGTAPEAGIDLEPNDGSASPGITDILVRGVRFERNAGAGLTGGGSVRITQVTIEDCTFVDNAVSTATGFRVGFDHSLVQNNTFTDHGSTATSGVLVFRGSSDTNFAVVRGNTFADNPSTFRVVEIAGTGPSVYMVGNTFTNNGGPSINTHGATTACVAGNLTDGVIDRAESECGTLPDVGYAPTP